jgi:hypothetical protein
MSIVKSVFRLSLRPACSCLLALVSMSLVSGCDSAAPAPTTGIASPALAILNTDYATSTVSLYDRKAGRLVDDCVAAKDLSKDAALPTGTQGGELVVIDREHAVIDFVNPTDCSMRTQLSVSTGGFKGNPHDVVHVSATKAYVLRYEKNAAPTAAAGDFDEGDDLLIIDPSKPAVTGRIDLSTHATSVAGVTLQARPDQALLANGLVYVTLDSIDVNFSAAGPGRVAIVDPATDAVTGDIDLPDQTGCSGLTYVEATKSLYVSCGGEFTDLDQAAKSALVEIDLSGAKPVIGKIISAKTLGTQPFTYSPAVVLGGLAYVGTAGALDAKTGAQTAPDSLFTVDLATATPTKVIDGGAYSLGRFAVDPTAMTLFLPDGDPATPHIQLYSVSSGAPVAGTMFEANPAEHLPPREVAIY